MTRTTPALFDGSRLENFDRIDNAQQSHVDGAGGIVWNRLGDRSIDGAQFESCLEAQFFQRS